jgi:hypothetical protein
VDNRRPRKKTCSSAAVHHKYHTARPGMNPGLRGGKPETNILWNARPTPVIRSVTDVFKCLSEELFIFLVILQYTENSVIYVTNSFTSSTDASHFAGNEFVTIASFPFRPFTTKGKMWPNNRGLLYAKYNTLGLPHLARPTAKLEFHGSDDSCLYFFTGRKIWQTSSGLRNSFY